MNKAIVVLTGASKGKNLFNQVAKEKGYWIWNINPMNVLGVAARTVGWEGVRDQNYYNFIKEFSSIADKYFDFSKNYIEKMIAKFENDDKTNVLVVHNCGEEISKNLVNEHGAFAIHFVENEEELENLSDDIDLAIVCGDLLQERIITTLNVITQ